MLLVLKNHVTVLVNIHVAIFFFFITSIAIIPSFWCALCRLQKSCDKELWYCANPWLKLPSVIIVAAGQKLHSVFTTTDFKYYRCYLVKLFQRYRFIWPPLLFIVLHAFDYRLQFISPKACWFKIYFLSCSISDIQHQLRKRYMSTHYSFCFQCSISACPLF